MDYISGRSGSNSQKFASYICLLNIAKIISLVHELCGPGRDGQGRIDPRLHIVFIIKNAEVGV